jgi:hypothetical protein
LPRTPRLGSAFGKGKALRKIVLFLEAIFYADEFFRAIPTELLPDAYRFMVKTAQYMMKMMR